MGGNLIVKNASELVTCSGFQARRGRAMRDLGIIHGGAVVIRDGVITTVGATEDILKNPPPDRVRGRLCPPLEKGGQDVPPLGNRGTEGGYTVIDAAGCAVLPGFVDSHTHFVFGGYREEEFSWRLSGHSYMEIMRRGGGILGTVAATRAASKEELTMSALRRLDSMLSFGVTTVEGKSGYGLDLETEVKQLEVMAELDSIHPVEVVRTFLGAHAVPAEYMGRGEAYIDFIIREVLPRIEEQGLAEFCDIFCEKGIFEVEQSRRVLLAARKCGLKLKIHADEIAPLGGAELAAELGAVSADHLLHASDAGIRGIAQTGVIATLLPATAFSLREPYARARFMIDSGCAVALASDFNPGSCFTESVPLVVALAVLQMGITLEEAITALTINGAAALGRADKIGSIDVGKKGDLVILEFPSYRFIPYHIGVSSVEKVIKEGTVVYDKKILEEQIVRRTSRN